MLRVLLKKQFAEFFRAYFYDGKKNRMRSKGAIVGLFITFALLLLVFGCGIFATVALSLCSPLHDVGMGWLYYLLMGGIAIVLGTFGSVFNTYSGLYLSRDNDLLLSLPIPVGTVIKARLAGVYLMGALYSAVAMLPVLLVSWAMQGITAARLICGLLLYLIVTVVVLLLSCLLGWVVARVSLRLKNKSFISVIIALLLIAAYYFFYFRANNLLRDFLQNAEVYGQRIRGAAAGLWFFGRIGEGDWLAAGVFLAAAALLAWLMWTVLRRSFLRIATAGIGTAKARYTEKPVKQRSVFAALLGKELGRFTASANYMLNCGLGILFLPAGGVLLLVKGRDIFPVFDRVFSMIPNSAAVLLCAAMCLLSTMNNMAAPSVSLEGKCLWIPQSLPVTAKTVLRAKSAMQLLLTGLPMLIAGLCAALTMPASLPVKLLVILTPLLFSVFSSVFCTFIGVRMPVLNWTNELAPIKQSGAVLVCIFGSMAFCAVMGGLYMLLAYPMGAALYLLLWCVLFILGSLMLLRWLDTKGAEIFVSLRS